MKWPKKVIIGGIPYRVKYVVMEQEAEADLDPVSLEASIDYRGRTIRLVLGTKNRRRCRESILEGLVHELVHGIFESHRLLKDKITDDDEERFVDELARAVFDTLSRNKLLRIPAKRPPVTERRR